MVTTKDSFLNYGSTDYYLPYTLKYFRVDFIYWDNIRYCIL